MASFSEELGRLHYRVETDTRDETFEMAIYTHRERDIQTRRLHKLYGKSHVRWVPNPGHPDNAPKG
jgi:hypothetical protein